MSSFDEYAMLFRLGSKKYFDDYYKRHRYKRPEIPVKKTAPLQEEEFIVFLANYRRSQKITQQEMARRLRTVQSAISRFELGRLNPSILFIRRYCQALGLEPHIQFRLKGSK